MKVDKRVIMGVGILAIAIVVVFIAGTNKSQEQEAPPTATVEEDNIKEKEEEIRVVDVSSIDIPENAANIKGLSEELDSISIEAGIETISSNNIETIASSVGLIGEVDETLNINRYQLADILYNIMYECNKLPDIYGYQLSYKDAKEIPTKYVQPVCYITYLELYTQDENYSGYNWITEDELNEAMTKLKVYLENYVEPEAAEKEKEKINDESMTIDTSNMKKSNKIQSSAIFTRPSKIYELRANINNLAELDLSSIKTKYIGDTVEEEVNIDYIEYWQGLYGSIEGVNGNIVGLTKAEKEKFKTLYEINNTRAMTCKGLIDGYIGYMFGIKQVVGIKNNNIISLGHIINDVSINEDVFFVIENMDIDAVGFLIPKNSLESNIYSSDKYYDKSNLILLMVEIVQ